MKRTLIQIKTTKEFKDIVLEESKKRNMTMTSFISACVMTELNERKRTGTDKKTS